MGLLSTVWFPGCDNRGKVGSWGRAANVARQACFAAGDYSVASRCGSAACERQGHFGGSARTLVSAFLGPFTCAAIVPDAWSLHLSPVMPFFDVQKRLGISLDRHMTIQSSEQPYKIASRCHAFEKEWLECAHGIGATRAEKECKIEYEDLVECLLRQKTIQRMSMIKQQRAKLIKEGTYTPPPHHLGKEEPTP